MTLPAVPGYTAESTAHWAFQPAARPIPPAVENRQWVENPIDAFIAQQHARHAVEPAARADKRDLIRRVMFDLTGLPPSPAEVTDFVNDPSTEAFATVINRLLDSSEYGVRWARHWLDTVRYTDYLNADPLGKNKNPLFEFYEAYRYRDWVVDALNSDMPYDQFVMHQIAGDLLPNPSGESIYPDGLIATTVLSIGFWENGCADKKKVHSDIIDDQIDVVGQAFLGLTLACARCHDHKFDPLTQADYYGLAGIFYSSHILESLGGKGDHTKALRVPLTTAAQQAKNLAQKEKLLEQLKGVNQEIGDLQAEAQGTQAKIVAYYDFENNTDSTTTDRIGGYVGTLKAIGDGKRPGLVASRDTRFGSALKLDGTGYVDGTDQPSFRVTEGTLMAWFQPSANAAEAQIVGIPHGDTWESPHLGFHLYRGPTGQLGAQTSVGQAVDGPNVPVGQWHHVAATYNGSTVKLYYDGAEVTSEGFAGVIQYAAGSSPSLTIGVSAGDGTGNPYIGLVDEVKLFNKALHQRDIQAAMQVPEPMDFAAAVRGKSTNAADAERLAVIQDRVKILEQRVVELQDSMPPAPRLAMAIQEGGIQGSLFPGIQDVPIHQRGKYDSLGEVVPRRMPQFLAGREQSLITSGSGRLELARWLASAENPLTARVIVNRVWQHHFGKGLVGTPNNFGVLGEKPTHPELLDWLTHWFIEQGWSLKKLHQLILLSATYQQSSIQAEAIVQRDVENRLYTRMSARRLEAEPIRDAMLKVAGRLDENKGGPAQEELGFSRRSLYIQTRRFTRNVYATLFDAANPEQPVAQRTVSTTAPQALFLLNNEFVKQQSQALAQRLEKEVPQDGPERIHRAYEVLFARPPSSAELSIGEEFLSQAAERQTGWIDYTQLLLCSNEFFYVN